MYAESVCVFLELYDDNAFVHTTIKYRSVELYVLCFDVLSPCLTQLRTTRHLAHLAAVGADSTDGQANPVASFTVTPRRYRKGTMCIRIHCVA